MRNVLTLSLSALLLVSCGSKVPTRVAHAPANSSNYGLDFLINLRDFADIMRITDSSIDKFLDDPSLTSVTREFGPVVIPLKQLPFRSGLGASEIKPWSSWWYPKKDDVLFKDPSNKILSLFSKYDFYRKKRSEAAHERAPGSASEWERSHYNPKSLPWEGLCDAWSIASISKPEPKRPVTVTAKGKSVTFSVGELKALLLKTYEAVDDQGLKYYGQKFTGDFNGWIYPDIFPEQFHRFLEVQIFKNRQSFIMDHDPGVEVWNNPVFKANYVIEKVPDNANAVLVKAWLYTAEPTQSAEKDLVGTREAMREYTYILTGTQNANGDLVVNAGYWIKGASGNDSRKDHPDYFIQIAHPENLVRKSWNPEIDVTVVDEILKQSY